MKGKIKYAFTAAVWLHPSPGGWHFVSVPKIIADEIRTNLSGLETGWGRLKATAAVGNSIWETAIWFDTKMNTYLLPLKAGIRKSENLAAGENVAVTIWI
ncbi:MAG: hypothetical protein RI973_72 [Bacteroidota bacterium]|jgi:hypothetical protein